MKSKIIFIGVVFLASIKRGLWAQENILLDLARDEFFKTENPAQNVSYINTEKDLISSLIDFFVIKKTIDNNIEAGLKDIILYKKMYNNVEDYKLLIQKALEKAFFLQEKRLSLQKIYEAIKESSEIDDELYFYMAYINLEIENYKAAKEYFTKIKTMTARDYYFLSLTNLKQEKSTEALQTLAKVQSEEYQYESQILKAHILYKRRDFGLLNNFIAEVLKKNNSDELKNKLEIFSAEGKYFRHKYIDALPFYETYLTQTKNEESLVLYRVASIYYNLKDYEKAMDFFSKISLGDSPVTQLACYYTAVINFKNKKIDEALVNFNIAKGENFDEQIAKKSSFEVININAHTENYDAAIEESLNHLKKYKKGKYHSDIAKILDAIVSKQNNNETLISEIEKSENLMQTLQIIYQKAILKKTYTYLVEKKIDEAFNTIKRVFEKLEYNKILEEIFILKGLLLSLNFEFEVSIKFLEKFLSQKNISPKNHDLAIYYLGMNYVKLGKPKEASLLFEKLKNSKHLSKDQHEDIILQKAHLYLLQKNLPSALATYESYKGAKVDIKNFHIATIYTLKENFHEAHAYYEKMINEASPLFYEAKLNDVSIYLKEKKFQEALNIISIISEESVNSDLLERVLLMRAMAHTYLKQFDEAKNAYRRLIEITPLGKHNINRENAFLGLKEILIETGMVEELHSLTEEYTKENATSTKMSLVTSGKDLFFKQNYNQAITILKKSLEKNNSEEEQEEALFFIGESYLAQGNFSEAEPFYEKCKSLKAEVRLANGFFNEKKFIQAEKYYKKLLTKEITDRDKINFLEKLGKIYFEQKNFPKSKEMFQRILGMKNVKQLTIEDSLLFLAKISADKKNYSEALTAISKIDKTKNSDIAAEAAYLEAKILFEQKKYDEAMDKLHSFNKKFYLHRTLRENSFLMIAKILITKKQTFQAKATLLSIKTNTEDKAIKKEVEKLLGDTIFLQKGTNNQKQ